MFSTLHLKALKIYNYFKYINSKQHYNVVPSYVLSFRINLLFFCPHHRCYMYFLSQFFHFLTSLLLLLLLKRLKRLRAEKREREGMRKVTAEQKQDEWNKSFYYINQFYVLPYIQTNISRLNLELTPKPKSYTHWMFV